MTIDSSLVWVFLGWWVVHYLSLLRDVRKERITAIEKIVEELYRIERAALDFHTGSHYSHAKAQELSVSIQRIFRKIAAPPLRDFVIQNNLKIAFRSSITLDNFDLTTFVSQPVTSELILNIRESANELIDEIEVKKQIYIVDSLW